MAACLSSSRLGGWTVGKLIYDDLTEVSMNKCTTDPARELTQVELAMSNRQGTIEDLRACIALKKESLRIELTVMAALKKLSKGSK
jgi:hypothetical protein